MRRVNDLRPLLTVVPIDDREDSSTPLPWIDVVREAVRPEFSAAVYIPTEGDLALWPRTCRVNGCQGPAPYKSLCSRHQRAWHKNGGTDMESWVASSSAIADGKQHHRHVRPCPVSGCRRSAPGRVCRRHASLARSHYGNDIDRMIETLIEDDEFAGREPAACYVAWCTYPVAQRFVAATDDGTRMCDAHQHKFSKAQQVRASAGKPALDIDIWMAGLAESALPKFRTLDLPEGLLWEVRYGLQARHDQQTKRWRADLHSTFVSALRKTGLTTLLVDEDQLVEALRSVGATGNCIGFARFTRASLELLRDRDSVDIYDRDLWDLVALGYDAVDRKGVRFLRFTGIEPAWLRQAAKEWTKQRLVQQEVTTVNGNLRALRVMSRCLAEAHALPATPADFTRTTIEKFMRVQRRKGYSVNYKRTLMATLHLLLGFMQRTNCAPGLPRDTVTYTEDMPKMRRPMPRAISEFVMAQIETPKALGSIRSTAGQTLLRVMIETGLRGQCARHLEIDALHRDPDGNPLMRFTNTKFKREAVIPISESLAQVLAAQRKETLRQWPDTRWLMPRTQQNPDGLLPYAAGAWKQQFADWKKALGLVDEAGRPVNITGHQFRHTVGTRMVNAGVPLEVVRAYLDHSSVQMTEVYARVAPTTVRRSAEAYLNRMDKAFNPHETRPLPPPTAEPSARTEPTRSDPARTRQFLESLFSPESTTDPDEDDCEDGEGADEPGGDLT